MAHDPGVVVRADGPSDRSEHYRDIYSNLCQGRIGAFDISLTFFQAKEIIGRPGLVHEQQATVIMSPVQFKLLAQLCNALADAYEEVYAPITVPPGAANPNANATHIVAAIKGAREAERSAEKSISDSSTEPKPPAPRSRGAARKKAH